MKKLMFIIAMLFSSMSLAITSNNDITFEPVEPEVTQIEVQVVYIDRDHMLVDACGRELGYVIVRSMFNNLADVVLCGQLPFKAGDILIMKKLPNGQAGVMKKQ